MRSSLQPSSLLLAVMAMPIAQTVSAEKVIGAYIYARHGDRTPKVLGNTQLTDLGYQEVYLAGIYYHNRYIDSSSSSQIAGISEQVVKQSQISASAPEDEVLQNSATGFLQGVYPPVGSSATQTLRNGTSIESPLNGYQLIPLSLVSTGTDSEDSTWLQGANDCPKAQVSSNNYFSSALYNSQLESTMDFYQSLSPMLNRTFTESEMTFKNAYTIFDYLNVASIHNSSSEFPSSDLLTSEVYDQLLALANSQQYNLAYNASEPVRAISGSVLAGEVLSALNGTITSQGKSKLNVQFGAYATFLSYFGLAQLPSADDNFYGMPDYASSMVWELVTNSTSDDFPSASEISVRFLFHNGTVTGSDEPSVYPLYGQSSDLLSWSDFVDQTTKIAVTSDADWCNLCGKTDGICASTSASSSGSDSSAASTSSKSGGMSRAVAGVVGAMVTLAVILGLEALFLLLGGFRITKKRASAATAVTCEVIENKKV